MSRSGVLGHLVRTIFWRLRVSAGGTLRGERGRERAHACALKCPTLSSRRRIEILQKEVCHSHMIKYKQSGVR